MGVKIKLNIKFIFSRRNIQRFGRLPLLAQFLFLSSCSSLLYFPTPTKYVNEKILKYPPTEVMLPYDGETELTSWYFEAPSKSRRNVTLIFFHGNGQNLSAHFSSLFWIVDHGYNFLIFDYPGYGPNPGKPSPESTVESGKKAIEWIQTHRPKDRISLFGQSLGGNVALRTLSEMPDLKPCLTTIESSFLSYKEVAQNTLSHSWISWAFQWAPYLVLSDGKAIASNIENLPQTPYLVIHGTKDKLVPFKLGKELYDSLPEQKTFWEVEGGKHIDTFRRHFSYRPQFLSALEKYCQAQR